MDILIKSFNRPYYLDRCLFSIEKYVKGYDRIIIADDGTPLRFLNAIQQMYPSVEIRRSPMAEKKSHQIEEHNLGNNVQIDRTIPTAFWKSCVEGVSEYFVMLEDDIWFTDVLSLHNVKKTMVETGAPIMKLGWWGNVRMIGESWKDASPDFELITSFTPKFKNPRWFKLLTTRKFKLFGLARRLKLIDWHDTIEYYTIYMVAGVIFQKTYWQHLFSNPEDKVFELEQLARAYAYVKGKKLFPAKTKCQCIETSFVTSTWNEIDSLDLDFFKVNGILNETWLNGGLDVTYNFPQDFTVDYLSQILNSNDGASWVEAFSKWSGMFKARYIFDGYRV